MKIGDKSLTKDQRELICQIINGFGSGQHPVATLSNVDGFYLDYLKEIINSEDFKKSKENLNNNGKEIFQSILNTIL